MSNYQHLGDILAVKHLSGTPAFAQNQRRRKGAKGVGIRYEEKVQSFFAEKFGALYIPSPWFAYQTLWQPRWNYAQPDGLLLDFRSGIILIIEIKYSHCAEAYFQLVDKYLPLMRAFFGTENWRFATCEVVYWYDRAVSFPCEVRLCREITLCQPKELGVHICRP